MKTPGSGLVKLQKTILPGVDGKQTVIWKIAVNQFVAAASTYFFFLFILFNKFGQQVLDIGFLKIPNLSMSCMCVPVREPLALPCEPLLPRLSPRVRIEMPLKLLALVTGGRSVRLELSESVLLHGRGSRLFISLSVLLCRLLDALLELSLLPLQNGTVGNGMGEGGRRWHREGYKREKRKERKREKGQEDRNAIYL